MNKSEKRQVAEEFSKDAYFYYLREPNRNIFGGVYLKKVGDVWCRGMSLLSAKDKFDKQAARKYARRRLVHAICAKRNDFVVNPQAHESSQKLQEYFPQFFDYTAPRHMTIKTIRFAYKSRYNANLTPKEKELTYQEISV